MLAVQGVLCVHTPNTVCNRQEPQPVSTACRVMPVTTSMDVGLQAPAHALRALHAVLARIIPRALERPAGPAPTVAHVLQVIICLDALEHQAESAPPVHVILVITVLGALEQPVAHALPALHALVGITKGALERPVEPALTAHAMLVSIKHHAQERQAVPANHAMPDTTVQLQTLLVPVRHVLVVNTPPLLAPPVQQSVPYAHPALVSTPKIVA